MNPIDDQLNRLFRAAGQAEPRQVPTIPYGLETRVMAAFRAGRGVEGGLLDTGLLVRGLVLAVIIMGISFWPMINETTDPFSEYLQVADSTLPSDVSP